MRVIVTGATGFIGRALCKELIESGYEVVSLTRNPQKANEILGTSVTGIKWDGKTAGGWKDYADGACAIVNLAGENIAGGRWTKERKQAILESRLNAGKSVVEAIRQAQKKPGVVIQASAVGYYGSREDEVLDESSSKGRGFLSGVSKEWELSTKEVEDSGVRRAIIRTGVVLGKCGGALPRLIPPFRFFLGGPIGNGNQWFSWIHLKDEVNAIKFLIENERLHGIFNLTAPEPLMMKDFCKVLGKVMKRPSWLKVPGFAMRTILGEMADEMLLTSQRVLPKRLSSTGYKFLYTDVESALLEILL